MKKTISDPKKILYTGFFLFLTFLILTHSAESLYYALNGLNLWFTKMIPALFPFMILSGVMIRLHLTESFVTLLYPFLHPLLRVRKNVIYAVVMGFLCGFPMGAKVTCDLLERNMITHREAEFLLAFCNNIGPVYFCSFVLPLLNRRLVLPYLTGMYGLPLLYGAFLRRTAYRDIPEEAASGSGERIRHGKRSRRRELSACAEDGGLPLSLLSELDEAITSSIRSILMLGGYMILFNLFNLIPGVLCPGLGPFLAPVLEITGGLSILGDSAPLLSLLLLPFGGFSCIAQTFSMVKGTGLFIGNYVVHKLLLTFLTAGFYLVWFFLSPVSFLR